MDITAIYLGITWAVVATGHPCYFWDTHLYHDGYCYKLGTVLSNWTDAQVLCGQNISQARLAEPVTAASLKYLAKTVTLSGEDWWIGGVLQNQTFLWASLQQPIQSGDVSTPPSEIPGRCVQLTDRKKELIVPVMSRNTCSARQKFICQLYVGNPCDNALPGGDYFNDGNCYKLNSSMVYIEEATAICNNQSSHLAEFYSNDSYYYFKSRIFALAAKDIFIAANTTVSLEVHNITLPITGSFQLLTCGNVKMYLWAEMSVTSSGSFSPIGGLTIEYYIIEYGIFGMVESSFKYCNSSSCYLLATGYGANVNCSKFLDLSIYWTAADNCIWVSDTYLMVNFTYYNMTILPIGRMAISMENSSALFVFPDPLYSSVISLGGGDIQEEGVYVWLSNNMSVAIDDWVGGEPNDWGPGEDHISWRFFGLYMGLNDFNGSVILARPLCQRDILLVTYLMVVPASDTQMHETPEVHVTSGLLEVVYLHFQQRLNSGESILSHNWVTSYHNVIFGISSGVELQGTGFYHGIVVLKATNHVTVIFYHTSVGRLGSTLVLPVKFQASGYFVLTNSSPESGSYITIAALENNTDVIIKFPRDQLKPFSLSISGYNIEYIGRASVHLDQFDTTHIQSMDDFSGSFVHSTQPIVVYSGSKYTQNNEDVTERTLDMALYVESLSTQYVTYTSGANTSNDSLTNEKFRLLPLFDNTEIMINGSTVTNMTLAKAGSVTELLLPAGGFYFMHSDPYHPFYVIKVTLTSGGACTTSLLPDTLWRSQYDLYITYQQEAVAFVVERNLMSSFLVDGIYNNTYLSSCLDIEGTTLIGCTINLERGLHHIGFNNTRVKFVAYGSQTSSSGILYCHALGSSHGLVTEQSINTSQERFPSVEYIKLQDSGPFPAPKRLETTTLVAATKSQTTRAQITRSNNPGLAIVTSAYTHTVTNRMTTTFSSNVIATTTIGNATLSSPTTQATITPMTSSLSTDSLSQLNVSKCLPLMPLQLNLSQQELDLLTQEMVRFLLINFSDTSAFKQRMQSTWEDRTSCHVIGVLGVAIVTCFISLFLSNDILRLLQCVLSSVKKRPGNHNQGFGLS